MRKNILALVLCAALGAGMLAGCSKKAVVPPKQTGKAATTLKTGTTTGTSTTTQSSGTHSCGGSGHTGG